jgi:very-short-patch-repair endonuclease
MAAVLACGPGAVVSHQSAAALWLLLPRPDDAPVDVIPHAGDRGRRADIRAHRVPRLAAEDVTGVDGIPVTTPARTLLDLAAVVSLRELEQALAQAERRQLATDEDLMAVIERNPTRRGVRVLRRLLERGATPAFTRSDAEARFLALIRRAQLPDPEVNVMFAGYEIDFLWRSERLAVEIDGFAFHGARSSFERDRRRDAQLSARGLHVIRVTWRQIVREPEAVLVRTAQTLARCGFRQ